MTQLPPMRIDPTGAKMPTPTKELLDGVAHACEKAASRYQSVLPKHKAVMPMDVWQDVARAAYAYLAVAGGAHGIPIKERGGAD